MLPSKRVKKNWEEKMKQGLYPCSLERATAFRLSALLQLSCPPRTMCLLMELRLFTRFYREDFLSQSVLYFLEGFPSFFAERLICQEFILYHSWEWISSCVWPPGELRQPTAVWSSAVHTQCPQHCVSCYFTCLSHYSESCLCNRILLKVNLCLLDN